MLKQLFRPRPQTLQAEALYARVVDQARQPAFYTTLATPDRIDARFELYTLHVLLLLMRLRAEGERGADIGQRGHQRDDVGLGEGLVEPYGERRVLIGPV